jgi:transposase
MTECENCKRLEKRIAELEKRLAAYENAHTPSSRRIFKQKPRQSNGKIGRPEGVKGSTRAVPKPDRQVEKKFDNCPECKGRLKFLYKESKIIEDIPEPQPVIVTEFIANYYHCDKCGEVVAKPDNCPDGRFGTNVLAHCSMSRYEDRLPFRKINNFLKRNHNIEITPASIMNMTRRVSEKIEPEYRKIIDKIRISPFVHADETSMPINGINHWIWIFVAKDAVLCVVRKSRGKKVVREILGEYRGVVICDGWKAYLGFAFVIQRCWAHLLREAFALDGKKLFELLHNLFLDAKNRKLTRDIAEVRLRKIISRKYGDKKAVSLLQKIENGFNYWFTFLTYNVEPTNNAAEQALREHVIIRKIIGCLRSLKGAKVHEIMMSCFGTWKMQKLNLLDTLVSCLRS